MLSPAFYGRGVFFIVSGATEKAQEEFRRTRSGDPHITVFYCKKKIPVSTLVDVGSKCFATSIFQTALRSVLLTADNVSTTKEFEESTGRVRCDVHVYLDEDTNKCIENLRNVCIQSLGSDMIMFNKPHITHSVHYNEKEAQNAANALRIRMPLTMWITGFTV